MPPLTHNKKQENFRVTLETPGGFHTQVKTKEKQQKPQRAQQSNSAYIRNKQLIPEQQTVSLFQQEMLSK